MAETVHTFCRICEAGCGLTVTVEDNHILRIAPDKDNPYTWQDFCAKGRTAKESVEHPRRLLAPMKRVGDRYVEVGWDEAVGEIAAGLNEIIRRHGKDAVAFYNGNPWGFSGSNPFFAAAMQDAVGTTSLYNVGSIDQNNSMVVAELMYGSSLFSLVPDVDDCKCFLFLGMNPADSAMVWVSVVPNGWRRVLDAQAGGADLIVVDPRRTPTAERADLHVAIRPGADWAFLLGVVHVIFDRGWEDAAACAELEGIERLRRLAADVDLHDLADRCDVPAETIVDVARRFAHAPASMCVARTGVSQHLTGTIGEWLSQVLNHVVGSADRPGGRRLETGYVDMLSLIDRLVPPLTTPSRVRGLTPVWGAHPLAELPDEITTPGPGQVRAMVINAGNPVVMGPEGAALDAALAQLELLVAVDLVQRESHRHAHWLIPAAHWLERDELLIARAALEDAPFVQYGRRAVDRPPGVREEWEFFVDLALAMRRPLFGRRGVNAVIRASRVVSRVTRRPGLAFNPNWIYRPLVRMGRKVRWRDILSHPHGLAYAPKEYGHLRRQLRTPDKRVHVAPEPLVDEVRRQLARPPTTPPPDRPLAMIGRRTSKNMNSWLNDLAGLADGRTGDELEMHPDDAARLGLADGQRVRVASSTDALDMRLRVSDATRPGVVVAEQGWGSRVYDPRGGAPPEVVGVNRNRLVTNRELDPLSGTPALNGAWVCVSPVTW